MSNVTDVHLSHDSNLPNKMFHLLAASLEDVAWLDSFKFHFIKFHINNPVIADAATIEPKS